jgi:uncharacterized protein DUF4129
VPVRGGAGAAAYDVRAMERTRVTAAAAGLLALLAVVAAASRTRLFHEEEPPVSLAAAHLLIDFAAYLFIGILLLSAAVMVWVLWPGEGYDGPQPQRRSLWQMVLQVLALAVVMALLAAAFIGRRNFYRTQAARSGGGAAPALPVGVGGSAGAQTPPAFDWAAAGLVLVTLVLIAFAVWRSMRRRRRVASERRALARDLAAVVEDSLEDLRLDEDPRRAVIQAYARMERVLSVHGLTRREAEAPREFLARALRDLPVSPAALDRLTALFEEARFSTHDITPAMRADAVDALARIRDDLTAPPAKPPAGTLHVAH